MKTKGIIRRVDNLGRVVIPREYRKLYKISLGDPMEISYNQDGEIILRKVDMTLTLSEYSLPVVKLLSEQLGGTVMVSNMESFICGSGLDRGFLIEKELPPELRLLLDRRKLFSFESPRQEWEFASRCAGKSLVCEPITGESDVFGGLFLIRDGGIRETDGAFLRVAAAILGSSLQKY